MWSFVLGFISGIYVGTHYECKPLVEKATLMCKSYFPEKKEKGFWDKFN